MGSTGIAAAFAFCAGLAGAVQVGVQGRLGERIGNLEAVFAAAVVGLVVASAALLLARRGIGGVGETLDGPPWQLLGGVMSVIIVLAITVAGPRIGVVAVTTLLIAGQLGLASLIDRFGWFGGDRIALGWPRLLGIALLVAGAALTLRR